MRNKAQNLELDQQAHNHNSGKETAHVICKQKDCGKNAKVMCCGFVHLSRRHTVKPGELETLASKVSEEPELAPFQSGVHLTGVEIHSQCLLLNVLTLQLT